MVVQKYKGELFFGCRSCDFHTERLDYIPNNGMKNPYLENPAGTKVIIEFDMPDQQYQRFPGSRHPCSGAGSISTKNGRICFEYHTGVKYTIPEGQTATMKYLYQDGQYSLPIAEVDPQTGRWVDLR